LFRLGRTLREIVQRFCVSVTHIPIIFRFAAAVAFIFAVLALLVDQYRCAAPQTEPYTDFRELLQKISAANRTRVPTQVTSHGEHMRTLRSPFLTRRQESSRRS
jgi:hypothetical protein